MRLLTRRYNGRLLVLLAVLVLVYTLTYLPDLGFDAEKRENARGLCNLALVWWTKVWARQLSLKALPPELRDRIGDADLHVPMGPNYPTWCARCSEGKTMDQWGSWAECKFRRRG